jgi:hypothetical protein
MDIDETGRDDPALGVDLLDARAHDITDRADAAAVDRDIAGETRAAVAVEDFAAADHQLMSSRQRVFLSSAAPGPYCAPTSPASKGEGAARRHRRALRTPRGGSSRQGLIMVEAGRCVTAATGWCVFSRSMFWSRFCLAAAAPKVAAFEGTRERP